MANADNKPKKHVPQRTCVACREVNEKRSLIRIVRGPEGVAVEMADCIIRILDWAGHNDVDMDAIIREKHEYNKSRPYRHGDKVL